MILKWAWREIFSGWRLSFFFILNISLGLTGYISIEAFKSSLQNYLSSNSKQILSADLSVSARRMLTEQEIGSVRYVIGSLGKETQVLDFFAMLNSASGSRLVSVKAIDSDYPFYGSLNLERSGLVTSSTEKIIIMEPQFWSYQDLKYQMELKPGDEVSLGNLKIKLNDFVLEDSTQTFRGASLAPKIFINRQLVDKTGLIKFGSTLSHSLLFKINSDVDVSELQKKLLNVLVDPAIQVDSAKTAGEDSGRQLGYLSDFLGLVSLVSIFLSGIGITYIYQLFLEQRLKEIAIYRSLGLTPERTLAVFILQASLLGLASLVPSALGARLFIPILNSLLKSMTAFPLNPQITLSSLGLGGLIAVGLSLLLCLPLILQIRNLNPAQLFREEKNQFHLKSIKWWLYIPSLLAFWALALFQSNSIQNGSLFVAILVALIILLTIVGWLGLRILDKFSFQNWKLKLAIKSLVRRPSSSLSVFITIAIGTLLMNLLPQLKTSLKEDLSFDSASPIPSIFLFDIQEDQISKLTEFLRTKNVEFKTVSPMIRARILKINETDYERMLETSTIRTRESEMEARMRNRGVNLSYRNQLSDSEQIIEGRPLSQSFDAKNGLPELSVESKFAERMGIRIGDRIQFDVQGINIESVVVNFRRVKWTSFQPNFFILFQDGVLNDAPKTYIGILPSLSEPSKQSLMTQVVQQFSNVSMIDISRVIKNILQIAEQMSWSLELMSALAFFTGYIVLFSIIRSQVRLRRWELNMLKILGSEREALYSYLLSEFVGLSFFSSVFGVATSYLVSGLMMKFVFDSPVVFSLGWSLSTTLAVPLLAAMVCYWASRSVIKELPIMLLRES